MWEVFLRFSGLGCVVLIVCDEVWAGVGPSAAWIANRQSVKRGFRCVPRGGVGHSPGGVLAFAVLADLGRAVLAGELVAFILGGHAVGDADEAMRPGGRVPIPGRDEWTGECG